MIETTAPTVEAPPAAYIASAVRRAAPDTKDLMRFEAEKKSAGVAFALCWFLGIWGAHRFYLGRPGAVAMLIITIISIPLCFIVVGLIGIFAMWVWVIVDLFSVSRWVKEHNTAILVKIDSNRS